MIFGDLHSRKENGEGGSGVEFGVDFYVALAFPDDFSGKAETEAHAFFLPGARTAIEASEDFGDFGFFHAYAVVTDVNSAEHGVFPDGTCDYAAGLCVFYCIVCDVIDGFSGPLGVVECVMCPAFVLPL